MRLSRISCVLAVVAAASLAQAARTYEWPQWRGPSRDGQSRERSFMARWPDGGPKLLWTAKGIGQGFTTVAISDGRIYTAGNIGNDTVITAIDLTGKTAWQIKNGPAYRKDPPGTRGCPTLYKGWLYHESPMGHVICVDPKTEMKIWTVDLIERFNGRDITWGLSESLLLDREYVICCPGGPRAGMAALNRKTGKTVWVCDELGDKAGYASPILVDYKGLRQIVTMTGEAAVGVHAKTGKLLWRFEHKTSHDANVPTPIFSDTGHIFIASGYGSGGVLLKVLVSGDRSMVRDVWRNKELDNHHGGVLLVNGHLFGSSHRGKWVCLDLRTGKSTYTVDGIGKGSLTYADGKFYIFGENGKVALVKAASRTHDIISQFTIPSGGRGAKWAHPVVCNGRLYIRHGDSLFCYDIARQ